MSANVKVTFAFLGVDLDPEEITRASGLTPAKTWRIGEIIGQSIRRYRKSGWRIDTDDPNAEIEAQVDSVLSRLDANRASLEPFIGRYSSELSVVVRGGDDDESMPAVYFTPEQLRQLAGLGCGIDVDIYP